VFWCSYPTGENILKTQVITTPADFKDWCKNLKPTWSLDTETTSLNWLDLEIVGFSICDGQQACYVSITKDYKKELLQILAYYISEAKMIIFHNAPFDMMVLKKEGIEI